MLQELEYPVFCYYGSVYIIIVFILYTKNIVWTITVSEFKQ